MLIGMNKRNPETFDVYRINLKTGELALVAENPGNIMRWITDHAGRIRVAITTDGVNQSMLYRADESSPFATVITTNFREQIAPLFFDFDDRGLFASSNIGRDKSAIVLIDPATAKEERVLFEHPEVDVEHMRYSHKRKVLTEVMFITAKRNRVFLDAEMEAIHRRLDTLLPGY